jgi:hypothetical protein
MLVPTTTFWSGQGKIGDPLHMFLDKNAILDV